MAIRCNTLMRSMAASFLAVGLATSAWAQVGGGSPVGAGVTAGELEGMMSLEGKIICVDCTTQEARKAQPNLSNLYQLNHAGSTLVMQVQSMANPARWEALVGFAKDVQVRTGEKVWQTLTAEEHLFQDVGLSGVLSPTKTFDITTITIDGQPLTEELAATQE